ncbi:hypothetical protein DRQ25_01530 [Candidatus Fermentibacteria bacterium]|nr:MAG: hypothetical protein DRQ25_01530 [Candidatus Fermentibacteria bacterium]
MDNKPILLEAEIEVEKVSEEAQEKATAAIIELPKDDEKQMDLQYLSAILVSSGENLNHAYFLPSELVKAEGTIVSKALDIEHKEDEIIGHLYDRAFMTKEGAKLEMAELASEDAGVLDKKDMHVAMAAVVYKNRFPEIADEIDAGNWKVSMECYYQSYDVKIGDLIITRPEAEALGIATMGDSLFGRLAKVIKGGVEIAEGTVTRVLRNITFSGCGIVEKPANPPSVVLETAGEKAKVKVSKELLIINYDELEQDEEVANKVTSPKVEEVERITDDPAYELSEVREYVKTVVKKMLKNTKQQSLLKGLQAALCEAAQINNDRAKGD